MNFVLTIYCTDTTNSSYHTNIYYTNTYTLMLILGYVLRYNVYLSL